MDFDLTALPALLQTALDVKTPLTERSAAPYSLIKGGTDDARLEAMLRETAAYGEAALSAQERRPENLARFTERMVREGNPSSAAMSKVLGRAGAETFFRTAVLPVSDRA